MKHKLVVILSLILAALLALAGFGLKFYLDRNVRVAGEWFSREAKTVDLRGRELSAEEFQEARKNLPGSRILWDVPFQGKRVSSDVKELAVSSLSQEDVQMLAWFPELKLLDGTQCTDYEALLAAQEACPGCQVQYQLTLGDIQVREDAATLELTDADGEELLEKLRYLPRLERIALTGTLPALEILEQLGSTYPDITAAYQVSLEGRAISSTAELVDLTGLTPSYEEAAELLRWFPRAKTVNMKGCGLTDGEMMALADTFSDKFFLWDMTIGEVVVSTDTQEIDISGQKVESPQQIEDLLPYFPNVKKVVMSKCGLDDETMDALNKRHEDIRFVWSIRIQLYYVRTDTTYFFPFRLHQDMVCSNADLYPLRYCTDIEAIDIGHHPIKDCEWAAFMPNLKYLILAYTQISDITPLTGLKNLVYLELESSQVKDYSPLVTCTSLVDLNLSRTYGSWKPIAEMTWLEHLWWNGLTQEENIFYDPAAANTAEELTPYLPNTVTQFTDGSAVVRNGWRKLENYKKMRDALGVFYMD